MIAIALFVLAGCQGQSPAPLKQSTPAAAEPRTSVALRVLVVNDPPLAEAIGRLRGEWREQSEGELTATSKPWAEVAAAETIDADVIVFPTRYMGELCVRGQLRPVRKSVLEDKAVDLSDVFPLLRRQLIAWGGQVMALPLGIDFPGVNPTHSRVGVIDFLVRAAPDVVSPNRVGDLFDPETMKPRITGTAFVAALNDLSKQPSDGRIFKRVPVLGVGDRLAAVTSSSRNAASAFKFLAWLASSDVSTQLAHVGQGVGMPVRGSLLTSPDWYRIKIGASERGELGAALEGELCLTIPRIPGADEYMAALDEAVTKVFGHATPEEALQQAADKWEEITDNHGRESQRRAYLKHLGIAEP